MPPVPVLHVWRTGASLGAGMGLRCGPRCTHPIPTQSHPSPTQVPPVPSCRMEIHDIRPLLLQVPAPLSLETRG